MKSKLRTLEKKFLAALDGGDRQNAEAALRGAVSALDKAAKGGVIHWAKADRKKSRLAAKLNKAFAATD